MRHFAVCFRRFVEDFPLNRHGAPLVAALLLTVSSVPMLAEIRVDLLPDIESPAPVGTKVRWTAFTEGDVWDNLRYRFRVRRTGGEYRLIRDFGPDPVLEWTAADREGDYELEVAVRHPSTGDVVIATSLFQMTSRISPDDPAPVISPTGHPLVFLYSAPPCEEGARMRVRFSEDGVSATETPVKECDGRTSMNFYLAGLRADSVFTAHHVIESDGGTSAGPDLTFSTGPIPVRVPTSRPLQGPSLNPGFGLLVQGPLGWPITATNLDGDVVWYHDSNLSYLTRAEDGGRFWGISEDPDAGPEGEVIREVDLAGFTIRETNAARINEQLEAMGKRTINAFHHEVRSMSDGGVLVLVGTGQFMEDVQGEGSVYVLSDTILVLDEHLQVTWVWDGFDHFDPKRMATLKEVCTPAGGGCPPFHAAPRANDWLHGNSLQLTPDGHILYSPRHQDWLVKIDYANGSGSGEILWRLGQDGDFTAISGDPSPWFSHQHDGAILDGDGTLIVFDNGNVRFAGDPAARSRGQVWKLDEAAMTATLVLNADLGVYSPALGSAQKLDHGSWHFNAGIIVPRFNARGIEVDSAGNTVYSLQTSNMLYRSIRMKDLYTRP